MMRMTRRQFAQISAAVGAGLMLPLRIRRAFAPGPMLLDPLTQSKFVNPLPNALAPNFMFRPRGRNLYRVAMRQVQQWLGLTDPITGAPLTTTVWGYGSNRGATYPGKTFQVFRDQQIRVQWENELVNQGGDPLGHLLPVDTSLHWAFTGTSYTIDANGVPVVPHLHGGHTESDSDGLPEYWWTPGEAITGPRFAKSEYVYDNDQEAATLWYHDHALGITRLNVYAGLAGFYILRDEFDTGRADNAFGLPAYPYEVAAVLQDRMFDTSGQLFYPAFPGDPAWDDFITGEGVPVCNGSVPQPCVTPPSVLAEFFGDHILVNGVTWPKMDVQPRHYRVRLLNGSDSRFFVLQLRAAELGSTTPTGMPIGFYQIGTDDGFLPKPVPLTHLILGPGERADLVIDFSDPALAQKRVIMENLGPDAPFGGDFGDDLPPDEQNNPATTGIVMAFDQMVPFEVRIPDRFDPNVELRSGGQPFTVADGATTRRLLLHEGTDQFGRLEPLLGTVDGSGNGMPLAWDDPISENPTMNSSETWEIYNATADAHPIHLHLVAFEILNRQDFTFNFNAATGYPENITLVPGTTVRASNEEGPKDTVQAFPVDPDDGQGQLVRVKAHFDRPGRYVWHCHILSHEDHEMMRPYHVAPMTA